MEIMSKAAESAKHHLEGIENTVGDYYHQGVAKAQELERDIASRVQENPLRSVLLAAGIGAGAGMLLGILLRR
ncbi:MAG TPA: hypothetical protein VFD71_06975 [Planctomycetota bacterium]|jgi:ElaB/YqjD/DUF883 family membrane-anchored ribosome-binding protein|nr:hypothetical protein [Planctomycetota bacterium]